MVATRQKSRPSAAVHAATPATLVALEDDGRVAVRVAAAEHTRAATARLAQIAGYVASVGDRVLVAGAEDDLHVIAVLRAASPLVLRGAMALPGGGSVEATEGAVELRDPAGRLLVRYAEGKAEVAAPSGDLVLSAPAGRVVLRSGLDVEIEAARDVVHRAGRSVAVAAGAGAEPQLRVEPREVAVAAERVTAEAKEARLVGGEVTTIARAVSTTAQSFALATDAYELVAGRLVEKTRDAFRDVADLAQSRIGRLRTIVAGISTQRARRTVIVSTDDTSIDGRKIHLG